ncbi:MAG: hypothetical protein MHM6MM_002734 [Cercozoa sp. M6MM]
MDGQPPVTLTRERSNNVLHPPLPDQPPPPMPEEELLLSQAEIDRVQRLDDAEQFLKELIDTESTFLSRLRLLTAHYYAPMKSQPNLVPQLALDVIFFRIHELIELHETLYHTLMQRMTFSASEQEGGKLGAMATSLVEFFDDTLEKVYCDFVGNYDSVMKTLDKLHRRSKHFRSLLVMLFKQCSDPQRRHLRDILIEPVQRLPRYIILLESMLKPLQESDPGYKELQRAREHVYDVTSAFNEHKGAHDDLEVVRLVTRERLRNAPPALSERLGRRFLNERTLKLLKKRKFKEYRFLLFNDVLVHARASDGRFKGALSLLGLQARDVYMFEYGGDVGLLVKARVASTELGVDASADDFDESVSVSTNDDDDEDKRSRDSLSTPRRRERQTLQDRVHFLEQRIRELSAAAEKAAADAEKTVSATVSVGAGDDREVSVRADERDGDRSRSDDTVVTEAADCAAAGEIDAVRAEETSDAVRAEEISDAVRAEEISDAVRAEETSDAVRAEETSDAVRAEEAVVVRAEETAEVSAEDSVEVRAEEPVEPVHAEEETIDVVRAEEEIVGADLSGDTVAVRVEETVDAVRAEDSVHVRAEELAEAIRAEEPVDVASADEAAGEVVEVRAEDEVGDPVRAEDPICTVHAEESADAVHAEESADAVRAEPAADTDAGVDVIDDSAATVAADATDGVTDGVTDAIDDDSNSSVGTGAPGDTAHVPATANDVTPPTVTVSMFAAENSEPKSRPRRSTSVGRRKRRRRHRRKK